MLAEKGRCHNLLKSKLPQSTEQKVCTSRSFSVSLMRMRLRFFIVFCEIIFLRLHFLDYL